MILYNGNKQRVEKLDVIETAKGIRYPEKLSEVELKALNYYKVSYGSRPNRRYYIAEESANRLVNIYTISYLAVDRPVEDVRDLMIKDLKETFISLSERPTVDSGLGYPVNGGRTDLENFKIGKEFELPQVKDANGDMQDVDQAGYDTIILAIKAAGLGLYQTKWAKEVEIAGLTTIAECVEYEATPYEVSEDILGEDGLPTGETQLVTKYRNNVKEW